MPYDFYPFKFTQEQMNGIYGLIFPDHDRSFPAPTSLGPFTYEELFKVRCLASLFAGFYRELEDIEAAFWPYARVDLEDFRIHLVDWLYLHVDRETILIGHTDSVRISGWPL